MVLTNSVSNKGSTSGALQHGHGHHHCCIREQMAYALYAAFREPKLYRWAGHVLDWDKIPMRCRSHPKEVAFVHKYAPADTALHRIVRQPTSNLSCLSRKDSSDCMGFADALDDEVVIQLDQLKIEAVSALLEVNRKVALIQDAFGRTPLHLACMDVVERPTIDTSRVEAEPQEKFDFSISSSELLTLTLLDANPAAAKVMDAQHRTPLHVLIARSPGPCISVPVLQQLLIVYPDAVWQRDALRNETPLDVLRQRGMDEIENMGKVEEILLSILGQHSKMEADGMLSIQPDSQSQTLQTSSTSHQSSTDDCTRNDFSAMKQATTITQHLEKNLHRRTMSSSCGCKENTYGQIQVRSGMLRRRSSR